jgi:hypothetical protein
MESQEHDTYLAGLWRKDVEQQLPWFISPDTRCERRPPYRAPSWSWSAVDGQVSIHAEYEPENSTRPYVRVLNVSVIPKTAVVFGQIEGGFMRLSCRKLKRVFRYANPSIFEGCILPLFLDSKDEDINNSCFCLPIYMTPDHFFAGLSFSLADKISMQGLVIQKTGNKQGEYRQIGGFAGHKEADSAYEAVSEDDANMPDYESFVGEDDKRNPQYTITII